MNIKRAIVLFIVSFYALIITSGCGYKPTSYYAKDIIFGKVFVDVILKTQDSSSSIYIKDEVNKLVLNKFRGTLTNIKEEADSVILVNLKFISHSSVQTDISGYVKTYRTTVKATVSYKSKNNKFRTIILEDYHDYDVDSNSVLTTAKKTQAVKIASLKAISNLFSKIVIKNIKK